ncbi:MAG: sigma-54 dependent transcriptional regulator [Candidatus Sumerlaeia bacterium]|nr:sigma-54 dependent transcriptional regulator [Candidatus Sumerlaeia bacterium]
MANPHTPQILIVDDEPNIRFVLTEVVRREGLSSIEAVDGLQALDLVQQKPIDLVIMDIRMPRLDGMSAMQRMLELRPELLVLIITAHGTEKTALEAVQKGAYDFFTKPFDLTEVRVVLRRAIDKIKLRNEVETLKRDSTSRYSFENIIGQSAAMRSVFELIENVVDTDVTVLVTGESGTGKEMIASAIHHNSPRKGNSFVKVNTVAIPETLLESEMFGHEKGSFTGAVSQKIGKFEAANGGTLFLDEIGDMPMTLQAKLLRVLQERELERLGSTKTIPVDIRVVCATNRDLSKSIKENSFREDLYYRINVMPIMLPALRERREDIPLLIDFFIQRYAPRFARPVESIHPDALDIMLKYRWPGNVRELENLMQRTILMTKGTQIQVKDLPPVLKGGSGETPIPVRISPELEELGLVNPLKELDLSDLLNTEDFSCPLAERLAKLNDHVEQFLIKAALIKSNNHRQETADLLGISRKSLHNKMVRYNLLNEFKGSTTQFE